MNNSKNITSGRTTSTSTVFIVDSPSCTYHRGLTSRAKHPAQGLSGAIFFQLTTVRKIYLAKYFSACAVIFSADFCALVLLQIGLSFDCFAASTPFAIAHLPSRAELDIAD